MNFARRSFLALALAASISPAAADPVADFYRGKTVTVLIGVSPGGEYDLQARLIARFIGRHIPGNPNVVAQNMTGAGGLTEANWLYNIGAKDGLAIGALSRGAAFDPLFGSPGAQFDAEKLNWIGSANNEVSVCAAWTTSGVATFEDMLQKPLLMGGSGGAAIRISSCM